jgi:catechol 2,3-dioxygenase-like lactoylglutathione lyase family enzyme
MPKPPPLSAVRGLDHIGFTVPDLEEAHAFLVDVLGCEFLYRLGPFADDGTWMSTHLRVDDRAVMRELRFYRLGDHAVLEAFQYDAAGAGQSVPRNSDVGGHHVALYVEDLDACIEELNAHGVDVMAGPTASRGPSEGQRWIYFLAPWGMQFELVSYPGGKAFDHDPSMFR